MVAPPPDTPDGIDDGDWAAAISVIRTWCGWHIAPSITETVLLDSSGSSLMLPSLHVTDVAEVKVDGKPATGWSWSASGFLRGSWPDKLRSVEVTLTHGFDQPLPTLIACAQRLIGLAAAPAGVSSEATGPYSISYGSGKGVIEGDFYLSNVLSAFKLPPLP